MCTFMALTSSSLTVLPPPSLPCASATAPGPPQIGPSYVATLCSTVVTVILDASLRSLTRGGPAYDRAVQALSRWAIPLLLLGITAWGLSRGVPIYERFVEGAKEGWQTALRVLPYLVGMLVAIQVFQHSGALDQLIRVLTPFTSRLGFPPEALPMALIRPISGSGSLALLSQIFATYGADSFIGRLAATMMGSTETSLYVLTVYAGSVGLKRTRHTLATALLADAAAVILSFYIVLHFSV